MNYGNKMRNIEFILGLILASAPDMTELQLYLLKDYRELIKKVKTNND